MQELLQLLAGLARDYDTAVLLVHHLNKPGDSRTNHVTLNRLRGSSAIGAMARVVWAIQQPEYGSQVSRLEVIKSNISRYPAPLGFEIRDDAISWTDPPQRERKVTEMERGVTFLADLLTPGPQLSERVYEQAELAGLSRSTVQRAQKALAISPVKSVTHGGKWVWALPS